MLEIFDENKYDFMDSTLNEIKLCDKNLNDYLLVIDYFLGMSEDRSGPKYSPLTLRLKNVGKLNLTINKEAETYLSSLLTLAHISKKRKENKVEVIIESAMFLPEHKTLIYCLCDEVYIEKSNNQK